MYLEKAMTAVHQEVIFCLTEPKLLGNPETLHSCE